MAGADDWRIDDPAPAESPFFAEEDGASGYPGEVLCLPACGGALFVVGETR